MIQDWGLVGVRGKPIAASKVHDILANPFYVGVFRFNGEVCEGKHPPLVRARCLTACRRSARTGDAGATRAAPGIPSGA